MNTYIFNGRILPERVSADMAPDQELKVSIPEANLDFDVTISIRASQVAIIVDSASQVTDVGTLKNQVERLLRIIVDANGYLEGRGYDVEITSVVGPGHQYIVFGIEEYALQKAKSERPVGFAELWDILISGERSAPLQRALGNLRDAINSPHDTGFFCYRAVESLRHAFIDPTDGEDRRSSWERLRIALVVDRSWIDYLRDFGDPQRHGGTPYMSGADRTLAMQHAWKVVDRFVEYARRDYKPLREAEHPLLK